MFHKSTLAAIALGIGMSFAAAPEAEARLSDRLGIKKSSFRSESRSTRFSDSNRRFDGNFATRTGSRGSRGDRDGDDGFSRRRFFESIVVGNLIGRLQRHFPDFDTRIRVRVLRHFRLIVIIFLPRVSPRFV
jgi:hypothetical protein